MEETKPISFRLIGIKTTEFATFEKNVDVNVECLINTHLNFNFIDTDKVVGVNVKFEFECKSKPIIVIGISCFFIMEDWDTYFDRKNKTLTLQKNFAQHLAVITIGTTRGILHTKTEDNQTLNSFLLPSINVLEMVKDNIVIGR
jgi:hypothetical protein